MNKRNFLRQAASLIPGVKEFQDAHEIRESYEINDLPAATAKEIQALTRRGWFKIAADVVVAGVITTVATAFYQSHKKSKKEKKEKASILTKRILEGLKKTLSKDKEPLILTQNIGGYLDENGITKPYIPSDHTDERTLILGFLTDTFLLEAEGETLEVEIDKENIRLIINSATKYLSSKIHGSIAVSEGYIQRHKVRECTLAIPIKYVADGKTIAETYSISTDINFSTKEDDEKAKREITANIKPADPEVFTLPKEVASVIDKTGHLHSLREPGGFAPEIEVGKEIIILGNFEVEKGATTEGYKFEINPSIPLRASFFDKNSRQVSEVNFQKNILLSREHLLTKGIAKIALFVAIRIGKEDLASMPHLIEFQYSIDQFSTLLEPIVLNINGATITIKP